VVAASRETVAPLLQPRRFRERSGFAVFHPAGTELTAKLGLGKQARVRRHRPGRSTPKKRNIGRAGVPDCNFHASRRLYQGTMRVRFRAGTRARAGVYPCSGLPRVDGALRTVVCVRPVGSALRTEASSASRIICMRSRYVTRGFRAHIRSADMRWRAKKYGLGSGL